MAGQAAALARRHSGGRHKFIFCSNLCSWKPELAQFWSVHGPPAVFGTFREEKQGGWSGTFSVGISVPLPSLNRLDLRDPLDYIRMIPDALDGIGGQVNILLIRPVDGIIPPTMIKIPRQVEPPPQLVPGGDPVMRPPTKFSFWIKLVDPVFSNKPFVPDKK